MEENPDNLIIYNFNIHLEINLKWNQGTEYLYNIYIIFI